MNYNNFMQIMINDEPVWDLRKGDSCKDGGVRHHDCSIECFREKHCVPFTDSNLDENWKNKAL